MGKTKIEYGLSGLQVMSIFTLFIYSKDLSLAHSESLFSVCDCFCASVYMLGS